MDVPYLRFPGTVKIIFAHCFHFHDSMNELTCLFKPAILHLRTTSLTNLIGSSLVGSRALMNFNPKLWGTQDLASLTWELLLRCERVFLMRSVSLRNYWLSQSRELRLTGQWVPMTWPNTRSGSISLPKQCQSFQSSNFLHNNPSAHWLLSQWQHWRNPQLFCQVSGDL